MKAAGLTVRAVAAVSAVLMTTRATAGLYGDTPDAGHFDPKTMKFTNKPKANEFLKAPKRGDWDFSKLTARS